MDLGDVPAWGATGIALIAMVVAIVQAKVAASARDVAKKQAAQAEKSREAAERQAAAAEAALIEMRKQTEVLEHDRAARDESEGPRFEMVPVRQFQPGPRRFFHLVMVEGPEVDVTVAEVRGSNDPALAVSLPAHLEGAHRLVRNGQADLVVLHHPETEGPFSIDVRLDCVEVGGRERQWTRWETVAFPGAFRVRKLTDRD